MSQSYLREIHVGTTGAATNTITHHNIVIHELNHVCDSLTGRAMTGSWLWDSALVLSDHISTHNNDNFGLFSLHGKTVLELGAGTGLPGLTASRLGARNVILTDLAPLIPGLWDNVVVNGMDDGRVKVAELVWGSDELPSQLSELGCGVDVVLMSDVLYDPSLMGPLAKTLMMVCRGGTVIWAASEVRESTAECLLELASHGFEVTELASQRGSSWLLETNSTNEFAVYLITPPK
ncbi:protein N-lysine methyltransferase METTL21A-like [Chenopodium quinoa]|uniref:protein N-lysine methyltransferase METTL21A-like n=1 Tax=Chenopodium quinoa TaxID=63459 RepID=UPI000B774587|nr:protein N-lysine methyltransferase METTL21A-like [Chenopodium quinoa]